MTGLRALAVAQTVPRKGDVAANVDAHVRLARLAADAGARVVVFPELSLTGYEPELAPELAFAEDDARLGPLLAAAAAHAIVVVAGAPLRLPDRLCIGAFALAPDGTLELYTKRHLGAFPSHLAPDGRVPPPEDTVFQPGDRDPLLRIDGAAHALAICADTGRSSHPDGAAARGAGVYLASMFFTPAERADEAARLRDHAARCSLAVAMANFGGPTGGLDAGGRSAIWSDSGALLVQLGDAGEGVGVALEGTAGWHARALFSR